MLFWCLASNKHQTLFAKRVNKTQLHCAMMVLKLTGLWVFSHKKSENIWLKGQSYLKCKVTQ